MPVAAVVHTITSSLARFSTTLTDVIVSSVGASYNGSVRRSKSNLAEPDPADQFLEAAALRSRSAA